MGIASWLTGEDPEAAFNGLESKVPDWRSEAYHPDNVNAQGYTAQQVGQNALAGMTGSQAGQSAQLQALSQLQQQASGQLNAGDRAALYQALGQQGAQNRGQQGAITQRAAETGNLNSGTSLAAQLSAQQAGQEAGADAGVDVAGQAANRALAATGQEAQVGAGLNQQALSQQEAIGNAQNAINSQNANAENQANQFGANAANNMNQFNEANKIGANQFNAGLQQQQFGNDLAIASGKSGAAAQQEGADMGMLGSVAGGLGSFGGSYFQGAGNNRAQGAGNNRAHGGAIESDTGDALKAGGHVPGKAKVEGDSLKNDTVAAKLSPGEIVLPRSTVKSPQRMVDFLEKETGLSFEAALKRKPKK